MCATLCEKSRQVWCISDRSTISLSGHPPFLANKYYGKFGGAQTAEAQRRRVKIVWSLRLCASAVQNK